MRALCCSRPASCGRRILRGSCVFPGKEPAMEKSASVHWDGAGKDRKSTRLNSSHSQISYAVFCLKTKRIRVSGLTPTAKALLLILLQKVTERPLIVVVSDNRVLEEFVPVLQAFSELLGTAPESVF